MHDAGFSLERIGDYVGHSSSYMTDAYRHLLEGHEAEAAEPDDRYMRAHTSAPSSSPTTDVDEARSSSSTTLLRAEDSDLGQRSGMSPSEAALMPSPRATGRRQLRRRCR
jgi:hypothetical protein